MDKRPKLQKRQPQSDLHGAYGATCKPAIDLPVEIYDIIVAFAARSTSFEKHLFEGRDSLLVTTLTHYVPRPASGNVQIDRGQLAVLRLVSRKLCQSASSLYFQRIDASLHMSKFRPGFSEGFSRLHTLSQTRYAFHVRELVIGVSGWRPTRADWRNHLYYIEAKKALPELLQAFPRLDLITFIGPEVDFGFKITAPISKEIAEPLMTRLVEPFISYLTSEYLPSSDAATTDAPVMLESLIMDWQINYAKPNEPRRSDSQRYYRDDYIYTNTLFSFLAIATNLKHLCIRFERRRTLDIDPLDPLLLVNLQILELGGVYISGANLLALLSNSRAPLRALDLQLIQLKTGTWEDVFFHLCSFPYLEYLYVDGCGYGEPNRYSLLATGDVTDIEDPKTIETKHLGDYSALGDLQHHVMGVREKVGLAPWIDKDFTIFCPRSEASKLPLRVRT